MNDEIKLGTIILCAFITLLMLIIGLISMIYFVEERAENNYLKQQIETQKELIKELKEGEQNEKMG